ncbi:MAG: pyridoxamine 5'-phosphate oxidase family protein [Sporomusaceae bacterium]|nr:pyridoxamine 5'-phosphate oxidase family protein [Sporomusaceae bacterium]
MNETTNIFTEMRHKNKLMSETDAIEVLTKAEFGTLASIGKNGYPYAVPLNFVVENGAVYFHSAHEGNKINNIKNNAKVSFSAVSYVNLVPSKFDTEYDSAVIFGTAVEVTDEIDKRQALIALIKKYSSEYFDKGMAYITNSINTTTVYKIHIEHMTGKRGR